MRALPAPRETQTVVADRDGVVDRMEALPFGIAAWRLGAGRARARGPRHPRRGHRPARASPATRARRQPLFTLLADDPSRFDRALGALEGAWDDRRRVDDAARPRPLVRERITA